MTALLSAPLNRIEETGLDFEKFVAKPPADVNAVEIFAGHWATPFASEDVKADFIAVANGDARPRQALTAFFGDSFSGANVLELGPLEGWHTYSLEKFGAKVRCVEGNVEAYLKFLIMKNIVGIKASVALGNFLPMLEDQEEDYDLIFASGVLYHMPDPVRLLKAIARRTRKAYFWTHYNPSNREVGVPQTVTREGHEFTYFRVQNSIRDSERWWGGLDDQTAWMSREDILEACRAVGYSRVEVISEIVPVDDAYPHFSFTCER